MHRREVLKSMLALPALGLMGGCRQWFDRGHNPVPAGTKLCVILQGAFAVVLRKNKNYRVTAFVPKTDPKDPIKHEFRLQSPHVPALAPCEAGYHYELSERGLETTDQEPLIDRGFDNVLFSVNKWAPDPDNYFVMLDFPTPFAISYLPPLIPAAFDSGHDSATRLGSVPLNQVLEYRMRDVDIQLKAKHANACGAAQDLKPWTSAELLEQYKAYHGEMQDQADEPAYSERSAVPRFLAQYSYFYFFGAGVQPMGAGSASPYRWKDLRDHGVSFFNDRLLPAIYKGQPIPPGSKVRKLGKGAVQCDQEQVESFSPVVRPAMWQYSMPQAHRLDVASTENCTSPTVIARANS